ncbi:MAG: hypothetical protein EZS28_035905, partial [Streblomastix strix]
MPKARTRLEHAEQYAVAMTGLIDAQQALLVTMMNELGCYDNVKQLIHIYSMLGVGTNAVAELRELGNAPRELGAVVTGSILPADIFSDDSFEGPFRQQQSQTRQPQQQQHLYLQFQSLQLFQPFGIQQTPNAARQFNYGRETAAGKGFQARRRGERGRGAFNSNIIPLKGQQCLQKNKYGQDNQNRILCEIEKLKEQGNIGMVTKSNLFQWQRGIGGVTGSIDKGRIESRKNQSNLLTGSPIVEQNVCHQELGRRIYENNGLPTTKHSIEIAAFKNKQLEQAITGELDKYLVFTHIDSLHTSGNVNWNLGSTEDLCKDNINNNRQSEKQKSSMNHQLRGQHSISDAGLSVDEERNRVDTGGVSEIWMRNQRKQELVETRLSNCVLGIDQGVKTLVQRQIELKIEQRSQKIKSMARLDGKLKFSNPQLKQGGLHLYQINKQMSKAMRVMGWTSEMIVTEKCQTEIYWWVTLLENNKPRMIDDRQNQVTIQTDASISGWGSECDQGQCANQKDLRIIGSGQGEFELARDSGETRSRTSAERIYQPIGILLNINRNRQQNRVFINRRSRGIVSFEESDRFEFIERIGKWMDINNKTYRWEIEQRSGCVIKIVDGRGLFNKERGIRGGFEGLESRDNSGFTRNK